ncbi:hypothetical protein VTO73DRAFT_13420 [Trametes versicolor]
MIVARYKALHHPTTPKHIHHSPHLATLHHVLHHRRPEERCLRPELLQLRRDLRLQGRRVQVLNASPLPSPSLFLMVNDHIPLPPRSSLAWVVRGQHVG